VKVRAGHCRFTHFDQAEPGRGEKLFARLFRFCRSFRRHEVITEFGAGISHPRTRISQPMRECSTVANVWMPELTGSEGTDRLGQQLSPADGLRPGHALRRSRAAIMHIPIRATKSNTKTPLRWTCWWRKSCGLPPSGEWMVNNVFRRTNLSPGVSAALAARSRLEPKRRYWRMTACLMFFDMADDRVPRTPPASGLVAAIEDNTMLQLLAADFLRAIAPTWWTSRFALTSSERAAASSPSLGPRMSWPAG